MRECGNYRGIKLLSHAFKIYERLLNRRIRGIVRIMRRQFGFTAGRATTDAIFVLQQLSERHREKKKPLHAVFVDLEKAFDRVPRELIWKAMRRKGVPEGYVRLVQDMYEGAETTAATAAGETKPFPVRVGVHQGSVLSPLLFIPVIDLIADAAGSELPGELFFADDIAILSG